MGAGILPIVFQNGKSFILNCNSKKTLECFRDFRESIFLKSISYLKNKFLLNEFRSAFHV